MRSNTSRGNAHTARTYETTQFPTSTPVFNGVEHNMGHRAYVAYQQQNGTYNLHYTHWGATDLALCRRIDESNPLGGPNDLEPEFLTALTKTLHDAAEDQDLELTGAVTEQQDDKCVRPEPIDTNLTIGEIVHQCEEPDIEALYIVEQDFSVTGYHIEHINLGDTTIGNILFNPDFNSNGEPRNLGYYKGLIRGSKNQLSALINDGVIDESTAQIQFLDQLVAKFERSLNQHLLAHSTAITDSYREHHVDAFIEYSGRTRLFGVMVPTQYTMVKPWQLTDQMVLPPEYDQLEEHLQALHEETDTGGDQHTFDAFTDSGDGGAQTSPLSYPSVEALPEVSLVTTRNDEGVRVNGQKFSTHELPSYLNDQFHQYIEAIVGVGIGHTQVHECDACRDRDDGYEHGYLTTSSNVGEYKNPYTCSRSWSEERAMVSGLVGRHSPEAWDIELTIDGEKARVHHNTDDDDANKDVPYEITVKQLESYEYNADVVDETTIEITPPDPDEFTDYGDAPTRTVRGETGGESWAVTATFHSKTVSVKWERVDDTGDVMLFAYKESGEGDVEPLGFVDTSTSDVGDDTVVEELSVTVETRLQSRECESTDFTRVWPPSDFLEKTIDVHSISPDVIPNSEQHVKRMRRDVTQVADTDTLRERIAVAAHHIWERYGNPTDDPVMRSDVATGDGREEISDGGSPSMVPADGTDRESTPN